MQPGVGAAALLQDLSWGQGCLQLDRGMCVYTPARRAVFCAIGEPSTMPRALLASLSSFPAFQVEGAREESTLSCPGSSHHSKTAACKCSWQLFKTGKCVCVKSSFPSVGSAGMHVLFMARQHRPGSMWLRQDQTQAQHVVARGTSHRALAAA